MSDRMNDAAVTEMFESRWFGQGPAFWRWIETPGAAPYIEAFALGQQPPSEDESLDLLGDYDDPGLLDPAHLEDLAREIEARFGKEGSDEDSQ